MFKKKIKKEEEEVVETTVDMIESHSEYDPSIPENKQRHLR